MITKKSFDLFNIFFNKILRKKIKIKNSKEYKLFYDFLKNCKLYDYSIDKININKNIKKVLPKSLFISNEILQSIQYLKLNENYQIKIKDYLFNIHLYFNEEINIQIFLQYLCEYLQFLISLNYHNIIKKKSVKIIEINYYFTDHEKELTKNFKIPHLFKQNEINSGSCSHISKKKEINIWRVEDILKLTLHECIHALELDFFQDSPEIIKYYQDKYNISSELINTTEAYTELLANLLNCFLITQKINGKYKTFLELIHVEQEFCNYQSQKILYLSNINTKNTIDINKYTNILSYFIIRNEIFQNKLLLLLKNLRKNNYNFKLNEDFWFNYLMKNHNGRKKKSLMKKTYVKKYLHKNQSTPLIFTMKMNIFDLDINILS